MKSNSRSSRFTVGLCLALTSNACALRDIAGETSGIGGATSKTETIRAGASAVGLGGIPATTSGGTALVGTAQSGTAQSGAAQSSTAQGGTAQASSAPAETNGGAFQHAGGTAMTASTSASVSSGGVSMSTNDSGYSAAGGLVTGTSTAAASGGAAPTSAGSSTAGRDGIGGNPPAGGTSGTSAASGGAKAVAGSTSTSPCPVVNEFGNWTAGKAPVDIGRLAVNNFKPHTGDDYGSAGYAWTFAYVGSLQFTKLTDDTATNTQLIQAFEPYASGAIQSPENSATSTADNRAFGDLPLEIYLENGDTRCLELGLERADAQWSTLGTEGITSDARYWIDDMYMITSLQVFAYRATGDVKYLERAAKAMQAYIAVLQQSDGLFWHTKQSKAYWGRANGWVASGMTELLLTLAAGSVRDSIMAAYKKQMDGLVAKQISSGTDAGCWRQVLDVTSAAAESSCTAMFTYALVTGVKNGWLTDPKYVTAARNGWEALGKKTNSSGMLDKVCPGTGQAPAGDLTTQQQFYLSIALGSNDQHGQAPLLWTATALLRSDCPGMR